MPLSKDPSDDRISALPIARTKPKGGITVPTRGQLLATTEMQVEAVHFDLEYTTAAELGHRVMAAAFAEATALGAHPVLAQVSLGLRQETSEPFLLELDGGMQRLAKRFGVRLERGRDFPSPTALFVQVQLYSHTPQVPWSPVGAKAGDVLAVTGALGGSAAGLACLKRVGRHELRMREDIIGSHLRPEPRLSVLPLLRGPGGPSAAVELRDGLVAELWRMTSGSGCGAVIDLAKLPIAEASRKAMTYVADQADSWALYGAEDYELLVSLPARAWPALQKRFAKKKIALTAIGEVVPSKQGVRLKNREGELLPLERRLWHPFVRRQKSRNR